MGNKKAPSVTVSKLHIRYRSHWLFDQFDFHLPAGERTCLLGPSGVGKSSLLRFIAGLSYEKETQCFGEIITSDNTSLVGRLTYMTQIASLLSWLDILDNVLIGFRLRNEKITDVLEDRAISLLDKVGLGNVKKMRPNQLSCGMRQRVVLVRSLIEDRPVILMDEPFSALDAITRLKLQDLTASLLADRTVLLVTHDPLEALRLGQNIYVLNGVPASATYMANQRNEFIRDVDDPSLLKEQAELLKMLSESN